MSLLVWQIWLVILILTIAAGFTSDAAASPQGRVTDETEAIIKAQLRQAQPDLIIQHVEPSTVPGLVQVTLEGGRVLQSTPDGQHFVFGDAYTTVSGQMVNTTERQRESWRLSALSDVPVEDMIVYPAAGERLAHIWVFTDVSCGFCRKLHETVPRLNANGVEVRYLAFPRAGMPSASYYQMATAWCSENPQAALDQLKEGAILPSHACPTNPLTRHLALASQLQLTGTPSIITPTGAIVPGFISEDRLLPLLGIGIDME